MPKGGLFCNIAILCQILHIQDLKPDTSIYYGISNDQNGAKSPRYQPE